MAQSYRSQQRGGGRAANSGGTEFRSGLREPFRNEAKSPKRTGYNETRPESQRSSGLIFRKTAAKNSDSAFGQAFQEAQQKWACPDCGFRNYDNHTMCRRCRVGKRPSNEQTASTSERTSNISHHGVETKGGREGQWACPKCGCSNSLTSRSCSECSLSQSKATPIEKGDDDEILRADGWKHLRRRAPLADGQPTQQPLSARSRNPTDANTSTSATTAEQERMARLERTRDGRFVGLQQGRHGPETSSDRPTNGGTSHLDTSELAEAEEKTSAASKRNDNWARWEPSSPSEFQSIDPSRLRTQPRAERSLETLEGWDFSVEGTAGSGVPTEHNVPSQAVTADEGQKRTSTIRSSLSFDPNFEDDDQPRRPHRAENSDRYRPREDRPGPRGSGIRGPSGQNRFKQRRNSQFIASIDEFEEDDEMRAERWAERKQQREKAKIAQKAAAPPTPIHLPEFISVSNLAAVLRVRVENFTHKMEELGFEATSTDHVLDAETAGLIAAEFNFEPIIERAEDLDLLPLPPAEDKSILPPRPPVVTIMGHVDHGKTTLLDYLRKSSVAASEHGGITQHIGAFSVSMPGGRLVTFLDTPGHEAFLSMRQRGANVTDIVILVVAADDSVKPQTVEAIKHAQAAKVPMIVAVNKIDKEDSDVERVKQDLARYGVEIEDYGGDTQVVCVSGKTGQGMDKLEDAAVALADILDMRSEIDGQAEGWVLEATTKKAGRVATVLVRRGTLWPGDIIVAGNSWARVRSLRNEAGAMVPLAGPGTPVEIDGWREQPSAGDEVIQAPDEQKAKSVIEYRLEASERTKLAADMEAVNEARRIEQQKREQLEKAAELAAANPDAPAPADSPDASPAPPTFQEVFFIVKADVSGSVEAVTNSVSALGNSEVRPHILRSGVGPITEFDIDHAAVAKGHIINFNTAVEGQIRRTAESKEVDIIDQSIIYRLVDAVKAKLGERLPPIVTQSVIGEAEISRVFEINPKGRVKVPVAGCKVRNGVITKTSKVRVLRDKEVIFTGKLIQDEFLFPCFYVRTLTFSHQARCHP